MSSAFCRTHSFYSYNPQGSLTLTESYIEDEKLTTGINYEQRVYDDSGNMVKCISWNSLDSTSKFYTESDRAAFAARRFLFIT